MQCLFENSDKNWKTIAYGVQKIQLVTDIFKINHHLALNTMRVYPNVDSGKRHCTQISPITHEPDFDFLYNAIKGYKFLIYFLKHYAPEECRVYFTTEANAYGAIFAKWYNGKVEPYILKNHTQHYINLVVEEFQNLDDLCQTKSYYQCLSSKSSENASWESLCSPYSLPTSVRYKDL